MSFPEIQLLDSRAIIKLNSIFPKYLNAKDIRIGEVDSFSFIGKRKDRWNLDRRISEDLSESEKSALVNYAVTHGLDSFTLRGKTMSISLSAELSAFLDGLNAIVGCRVLPVSLLSNGYIYLCLEFQMIQSRQVSRLIMGYFRGNHEYNDNLIFYGRYAGKLPYILSLYKKLGNSLANLTLVESRWEYGGSMRETDAEGLFLNYGTLMPKQFSDSAVEDIILKLESHEKRGSFEAISVPGDPYLIEARLKSSFFNDFYMNVITEYGGPIFYTAKSDEKGLTSYYVVQADAKESFLEGLFRFWSLSGRREHKNYLVQVRNLDHVDLD
jgi:hypothetical protein